MTSRPCLGLLARRTCLLPTWRGWLALVTLVWLVGFCAARGLYGFLAVHDPAPGGILVAEGWAPDYALVEMLAEFRRESYAGLFVTGVPMEQGTVLSEYKTFAELSAATLLRLGADPQRLHAVPSRPVEQDRTYATAIALRDWLHAHHFPAEKVNIVTLGAHARRTRYLYRRAFGPATRVGILAIENRDFDPRHWWRSSQGFRVITGELIAYAYVRCFFRERATGAAP